MGFRRDGETLQETCRRSTCFDFLQVVGKAEREHVEEVMDYRTYCCASAKPTAALVLNLKVKKECKMDLPGRNVDFGALFPPLLQTEIPTRFLR